MDAAAEAWPSRAASHCEQLRSLLEGSVQQSLAPVM